MVEREALLCLHLSAPDPPPQTTLSPFLLRSSLKQLHKNETYFSTNPHVLNVYPLSLDFIRLVQDILEL